MRPQLFFILFLFFGINGYCQTPDFTPNFKKIDTAYTEKISEIVKDYDFSIAYSADSYWWANKKDFFIIVYKKDKWTLIIYKKHYQKDTTFLYDKTKPADISVSKKRLKKSQVRKLFTIFNKERFWTMNTDSLDITSRRLTDSTSANMFITDGVNYKFEIVSGLKNRIVEAYEPYEYLKHFPEITLRQNFINCREAFMKLTKKYRS